MSRNYDDVIEQLQNYGLRPVFPLETGRLVRCNVDGDREKKGWYAIHEMPVEGADILLVGTYGIWQGMDDGRQKITLDKSNRLNAEQSKAFAQRMAADKKQAESIRRKQAANAARRAAADWDTFSETGDHEYLERKNIQAYGVRFTSKGAMAIPVLDSSGKMHGVQLILDRKKHKEELKNNGRDKRFWPTGMVKKGHYHLIGSPINILLVAEGYATAASLHAATGLPVAVAFDAGNLASVVEALQKRYPKIKIIICADDDAFQKCKECKEPVNVNQSAECPACKKPHGKKNTGVEAASLTAMAYNCHWIKPEFSDPAAIFERFCKNKGKLTDFNDLHLTDGLHSVRTQIDNAIDRFGLRDSLQHGAESKQGGGDDDPYSSKLIYDIDEALERFVLIEAGDDYYFDTKNHSTIKKRDLNNLFANRYIGREFYENPLRKTVRSEKVGWDPAQISNIIIYNTFNPKLIPVARPGKCDMYLELLQFLCSEENDPAIYDWVHNWLATILQNIGIKMSQSIIFHGGTGTGKSLFCKAIRNMFGSYGYIVDENALISVFNEWAFQKLFIIFEEATASDKAKQSGIVKNFITGDEIRINDKFKSAHPEYNAANCIFLSNEKQPQPVAENDRRNQIIKTPRKLPKNLLKGVIYQRDHRGEPALHEYFLGASASPEFAHAPIHPTNAQGDMIELTRNSALRFYSDWIGDETGSYLTGVELIPMHDAVLYELYIIWCNKKRIRNFVPDNYFFSDIVQKPGVVKKRHKFNTGLKIINRYFITPPRAEEQPPGSKSMEFYGICAKRGFDMIDKYKNSWI